LRCGCWPARLPASPNDLVDIEVYNYDSDCRMYNLEYTNLLKL
jgi:hypothetical protein